MEREKDERLQATLGMRCALRTSRESVNWRKHVGMSLKQVLGWMKLLEAINSIFKDPLPSSLQVSSNTVFPIDPDSSTRS